MKKVKWKDKAKDFIRSLPINVRQKTPQKEIDLSIKRLKELLNESKQAKQMAKDLNLSDADAYVMELKSKLYIKCSELIKSSQLTHEKNSKLVGTSRAKISRIAN